MSSDVEIKNGQAGPWMLLIGAFALVGMLYIALGGKQGATHQTQPPKINQLPAEKPKETANEKGEGAIVAAYLTRRGSTAYQYVKRYDKVPVPFDQMPGEKEVTEALMLQGKQIPSVVYRVDSVTESLTDNLGLPTRSQFSYKAYLNPMDGQVMAYDLAVTSGGIPQRMVGRLNKKGVLIDIFRGGKKVDQNELKFPMRTSILPIELEFIHDWYQVPANKDYKKPIQWMFFVPEVMGFIRMIIGPPVTESLPHRGQVRPCARYDVLVTSTKAAEGIFASQRMWFDLNDRVLLRREDYEQGVEVHEQVVSERIKPEEIDTLQELRIRPPELPKRAFPYPLDRDLVYTVRAKDKDMGRIRVRFTRREGSEGLPAGYTSTAQVDIELGQGNFRREQAITYFDQNFFPLSYSAKGSEAAGTEAEYEIKALFEDAKVKLKLFKKIEHTPQESTPSPTDVVKDPSETRPVSPANEPDPPQGSWTTPLRLVNMEEKEDTQQEIQKPTLRDEQFERPLSEGTFIYDFNRVEHIAAIAFRFALPPLDEKPADVNADEKPARPEYQKVALYSVRQNKAGVLMFTTFPEPLPLQPGDDVDLLLEKADDQPRLYTSTASGSLLPSTLLLAPDGRLLRFTSKYGTQEVTYTLHDPIMLRRAAREQSIEEQKGPRLIRPPWN